MDSHAKCSPPDLKTVFRIDEPGEASPGLRDAVLAGINQILQASQSCHTREELGRLCLRVAEMVTSSRLSFIGELDSDGRFCDIAISTAGWSACRIKDPSGHRNAPIVLNINSLYGRVLLGGTGFYTNNPVSHPNHAALPAGHPDVRAFLGVPLTQAGRTIAMVGVANKEGGYRDDDLAALQALAPAMAQALSHHRAEEALRESEERFRTMANGLPLIVWVHDSEGQQQFVNCAFSEFLGIPVEKMQGDGWKSLMHPDDIGAYVNKFVTCAHARKPFNTQVRIRRADGQWRWIETWGSPRLSASGEFFGYVGTSVDITERKQAEEELRQLNETLERKVSERTELAETRARQLQSLAVELIEAEERERRRFSELLHEDLQQILASARLQLQGASQHLPAEPMLSTVEDLLVQSIAKSRRLSHELSPPLLHYSGLCAIMEWLSRHMHERYGLHVDIVKDTATEFDNTPVKVFLFRAVQELLLNVVKHSDENSARVVLAGAEGRIVITVSDNGKGFDPDALASTHDTPGFGLMSIKERVSYMGGRLEIDSAPENGARLMLTVPTDFVRTVSSKTAPRPPSGHPMPQAPAAQAPATGAERPQPSSIFME